MKLGDTSEMFVETFLFSCSGYNSYICTPEQCLNYLYKENRFTYMSLIQCELFTGEILYDDLRMRALQNNSVQTMQIVTLLSNSLKYRPFCWCPFFFLLFNNMMFLNALVLLDVVEGERIISIDGNPQVLLQLCEATGIPESCLQRDYSLICSFSMCKLASSL